MKNFATLLVGMALLSSAVGCCCSQGSGCYRPTYGGAGGFSSGNCGVAPGGYPLGVAPQGMYQNYNSVQAGYPGAVTTPVTAGAFAQPIGVPQTASVALEAIPTF